MTIPAITGYSDRLSVRGGETIRFMVSCDPPMDYRADLVRVIHGDLNPAGPGLKEAAVACAANGGYAGRTQTIHAGSYVAVPLCAGFDPSAGFSIQSTSILGTSEAVASL